MRKRFGAPAKRKVHIREVTHNLCPWCGRPWLARIPVLGVEGVDWAYGHVDGDESCFHFSLECTDQNDPNVMKMAKGNRYLYQTGGEIHVD